MTTLANVGGVTGATRPSIGATRAPVGYRGAATQTYVGSRDGKPYLTALVTGSAGTFTASPDALCHLN